MWWVASIAQYLLMGRQVLARRSRCLAKASTPRSRSRACRDPHKTSIGSWARRLAPARVRWLWPASPTSTLQRNEASSPGASPICSTRFGKMKSVCPYIAPLFRFIMKGYSICFKILKVRIPWRSERTRCKAYTLRDSVSTSYRMNTTASGFSREVSGTG